MLKKIIIIYWFATQEYIQISNLNSPKIKSKHFLPIYTAHLLNTRKIRDIIQLHWTLNHYDLHLHYILINKPELLCKLMRRTKCIRNGHVSVVQCVFPQFMIHSVERKANTAPAQVQPRDCHTPKHGAPCHRNTRGCVYSYTAIVYYATWAQKTHKHSYVCHLH